MAKEIVVPEMGESVLEATVFHWFKQEGDPVNVGEVLVELETDKVNLEVGAPTSGVLEKITAGEGADVKVGDVLGQIAEKAPASQPAPAESPAPDASAPAQAPPPKDAPPPKTSEPPAVNATPVATRMARDRQVDLSRVTGTGPEGRITRADVENFLQTKPEPPSAPPPPPPAAPPPGTSSPRPETRERMSRRRRTIAQRLLEVQQTTAMLTTFNELDMSAVMDIRKRRNEAFQTKYGIKLGFMSFFVKATLRALKAFPRLNAEIQGDEIVLKQYYDMGIAVGAEEGLVVPVIRDADRLSFAEIEQQIKALVEKSQAGKLSIEDLRGGTFTLTNGGVFGSMLSTPLLNPPQVGILGLHKIEPRPVAVNEQVVIRPMMYVALSYDHRIVDGREAVQFLVHIKELLEDPERLLLEG